ncbi:MAG: DNA (cytosine-5-)-methyltransferase [Ruminobacter sp.]|uniref:DNA (cytosine-5-)-methyltransferase n=1 Tax=Ruminobacter sp. TaxID=2774296 RepID=UPI001B6D168B|nr:DNA (cytosine-5-)-methyltransferase [Ruminobacter sp.]MBP3749482.1 DNA (cytosine-5-)-methyltransferase [Ruminobacter sp.]
MTQVDLKFIDLFAGIGGFRLGFENAGCKCVFSSEIDEHACRMYELNFGNNPYCDITKLDPAIIPDFDILCAGFPCQALYSLRFRFSGKNSKCKCKKSFLGILNDVEVNNVDPNIYLIAMLAYSIKRKKDKTVF